jgi:hypothetical protein
VKLRLSKRYMFEILSFVLNKNVNILGLHSSPIGIILKKKNLTYNCEPTPWGVTRSVKGAYVCLPLVTEKSTQSRRFKSYTKTKV